MEDLKPMPGLTNLFTANEFQKINSAFQCLATRNIRAFDLHITRNESLEVTVKEINSKVPIKITAGLYDLGW
jgi:hypothetical protein